MGGGGCKGKSPSLLKANFEIVMQAVSNDGEALEHASQDLSANFEIVLKAGGPRFGDGSCMDADLPFLSLFLAKGKESATFLWRPPTWVIPSGGGGQISPWPARKSLTEASEK